MKTNRESLTADTKCRLTARGHGRRLLLLLPIVLVMCFLLSNASSLGGCWVDMYWPLNDGDSWQFTREVTVGTEDMGDGEFWISQETPDSHLYEIHYKVQGKVYLDCVDSGWIRVCVSPSILLFDDDLLQKGGSRTTRTTVTQSGVDYPATFTITISMAGTVTVPAGTFLNCRNITVKETAYPPGRPAVSVTVLTAVLAPRVGLIRKRVSLDDRLVGVELVSGTVGGMNVTELGGLSGSLPPGVTTHPRHTTVTNNGVVTLTVSTSGQDLRYQWLKDGTPLSDDGRVSGAMTPTLRIDPVQYSDGGAYAVRVSNSACSLTSSNALLSVLLADLLVLRTNGLGGITPSFKGNFLVLGSTQTVTAVPQAGYLFSNWTDGGGAVITNHPTCKFIMQSNLVLIANIVPNPFPWVAGNYNGLFLDENTAEHDSSGFFKANVQASGAFSASLQTGARRLALAGRFGLDGKSTNIVARRGINSLTVELCLKFDGSDEMVGRVTDGSWSAGLLADRAVFSAVVNPATNFARRYTMLIPGSTNGAVEPAGDSAGSVGIAPGGILSFAGVLADGTPVTQSAPFSKAGDWPLYVPLYRGKGSIVGWLHVLRSAESDLDGRVNWFRPAGTLPRGYTNGFVLESDVLGSIYTPIGTNRALNVETARVEFIGGNLPSAFTNDVALGPNGRVTNASPNQLILTVVRPTGLFNGAVKRPGATAAIPFKGAILQRQGYGSGFFLGTNESGRVYFGP